MQKNTQNYWLLNYGYTISQKITNGKILKDECGKVYLYVNKLWTNCIYYCKMSELCYNKHISTRDDLQNQIITCYW